MSTNYRLLNEIKNHVITRGKKIRSLFFRKVLLFFGHISTFFLKLMKSGELKEYIENFRKFSKSLESLHDSSTTGVLRGFPSQARKEGCSPRFALRREGNGFHVENSYENFRQAKISYQISNIKACRRGWDFLNAVQASLSEIWENFSVLRESRIWVRTGQVPGISG